MNIAFVVVKHIARGGGIERYTAELGARLAARGHRVRVYSMGHHGPMEPTYHGMQIMRTPCLPLPQCEKLSAAVCAMVHASLSPWADVIHMHTVCPGAMGWFARLCRKPALLQFHGLEWKRSRWGPVGSAVLRFLERWSVRTNRSFTAVSQTQCAHFHETYGITARYIPGGAEWRTPPPAREIYALDLEPRRYVLFASRLVREKGAHHLIRAFRQLATTDKLVIAGSASVTRAYRRELQALAAGDPRIIFPGFVEGRLRDELFSHARVFVQPSDVEGLSLALLEALSYGLDCLVSDIPENIEAIDTEGITFRQGDADDLAAKLKEMLDGEGVPTRVAAAAPRPSWDQVADEFEQFYQELAAASPRATPGG
jgi:glycosyltransferase involved in cell wall biosynthesis